MSAIARLILGKLLGMLGAVALYLTARQNGAQAEKINAAAQERRQVIAEQEVRNEVEALDRDALKRRAASWVRGKPKR